MSRSYYSERAGRAPKAASLELGDLKRVFTGLFEHFEEQGYFQEDFGYECVDNGFVVGTVGTDLQAELLLALRKPHLWPVDETIEDWTEDDLFDMVEFLHDHVSKPTERYFHQFNSCGWHSSEFDRPQGRLEYRQKVGRLLGAYDSGFELSEEGQVLALSPSGLETLVEKPVSYPDAENVSMRVVAAVERFRRHRASIGDRRQAVRELVDVLEFLRPKVKRVLQSRDERDLFNLANNFGIRHHRKDQRVGYDKAVWLDWAFYYYLATIHAVLQLIEKGDSRAAQ